LALGAAARPSDSIKSIVQDTGASKGTLDTMRATLKRLGELGNTFKDIKTISWGKARWNAGREDHDHSDWIEAEADKLVDDIQRFKLGTRLTMGSGGP
jgi:hypothetical protein